MHNLISKISDRKRTLRILLLIIADVICINLASVLALYIRFEFDIWELERSGFLSTLESFAWLNTLCTLIIFCVMKLYSSLWAYAGVDELVRILLSSIMASAVQVLCMFFTKITIPRSFPVLYGMLLFLFTVIVRFSYRLFRREFAVMRSVLQKRTMLIGAGAAGAAALREFHYSEHSENKIVCVIDDDPAKWGKRLMGVKIIGGRDKIESAAKDYDIQEIIFAIPTISNVQKKEILEICQKTGKRLKTLPALFQLANGEISIKQIRDVEIEDLLGRDVVNVDMGGIAGYISGKTVLVTGGGGSIGSELCRQLAAYSPKCIVIFDIYENNAYDIQQELAFKNPEVPVVTLIGSVRDKGRIDEVMEEYRPDIVYHAAAHKHVPLMEDSPAEAIKNNVFGTINTAMAASRCGVKRFILISTDKAVNPTNVMGASKRICEMIVQMMDENSHTEYTAVRFGNVMGSNGSVIPLFKRQIQSGGPVTVTHKEITRFFMTIPEAVSLVLQAGAYAQGGEIFVLDMGKPVKVDDLARNMIRLSGFEPDVDIPVVYTGLRPGEKLYEELLMDEEGLRMTANDLIYVGNKLSFDTDRFREQLGKLKSAADSDSPELRERIMDIVPTYHPAQN